MKKASWTGLSPAQVVELHSSTTYHVYMLGFLPGMAYLGDVPTELGLPRRTTPRLHVPAGSLANVDGSSNYVRVQVLTNAGALDRDKQIALVERMSDLIAAAANDPALKQRTWVLLTEAAPGGWGLWGHAHTNDELVSAARAQIARRT